MNTETPILVLGDLSVDEDYNKQLLSKAKEIANLLGKSVKFICFNKNQIRDEEKYHQYGADDILVYEYEDEMTSKQIVKLYQCEIEKITPCCIFSGSTSANRQVAAMLAIALNSGLVADCIKIEVTSENDIIFSRAALGSSVIADILCEKSKYKMCTVKKDCFEAKTLYDNKYFVTYKKPEIYLSECSYKKISSNVSEVSEEKITLDTPIIIGVGRGAANSIKNIKELAGKINASIGSTKPVVDSGVMKYSQQIGQSGRTVKPDIYLALGISGASQHLVGMMDAKMIISVNLDPKASIREHSDYFFEEDVDDFVNRLLNKIKKESNLNEKYN